MQLLERAQNNFRIHGARNSLITLLEVTWRGPAAVAILLSLGAITIDYAIAPVLNTVTPVLACILFLLLVARRSWATDVCDRSPRSSSISVPRVAVFLLLHTSIVVFGLASRATPQSAGGTQFPAALAAAKYLVLLPTVFLLPWKQWRSAGLAYREEWMAAAVALVTLYPYRIFAATWPWYAQGLGHLAHALARPFVAGLSYIPLPTPTLSGPNLDVRILFACSGLEAIKLFQIVFVVMLVLDWVHLNKRRILFGYFAGMAVMLGANAVRIAFLAVTGNLAPRLAISYHLTLGWVFFACVAAALIVPLYSWLMPRRVPQVLAAT